MNSRLRSTALAAMVVFTAGRSTDAAVVVGLVLDPATTAGVSADVNSIYSGLGTWHLFALDDNEDDFGISSYNIDLTGATATRHTSPSAFGIEDANGDVYEAGFNTLRSANGSAGSSSIQASQPLPDQSPFLITGLGQQTGSFAAVTGGASSGGVTSPSWGTYNTISPFNGKNWLFLGEGKYDQGVLPSIAQATFTVYNNSTTFSSKLSTTAIVPEPITPTLLTPEYLAHISAPPPPPAPQPVIISPSIPPAAVPPPVVPQPVVTPPVVHPPAVIAPIPAAPTQPIVARPASEAVVIGMVVHPSSENGGSPGTWQLFAVDNNIGDFGISSYNVDISGATTVCHISPSTHAILDNNGDPIDAGFTTLRGVSGANGSHSIHASQSLPGQSPLLITGFGQETGSFAAELADRLGSTTLPAATSPDWGDYSTISPLNGKNWLLLAEGTYNTPAPPIISQATFTVYNDQTTFASRLSPVTVIPEPITSTLLTPEYFQNLTPPPLPTPVEVPTVIQPQPVVVPTHLVDYLTILPIAKEDPHETELPLTEPDPYISDGGWMVIPDPSIGTEITNGFVYYIQPSLIDLSLGADLPFGEYVLHGGLQYAMTTALTGLHAYEISIDNYGLIHPDLAPSLMSFSYNALGVDHHGTSVASYLLAQSVAAGLFDFQATIDAIPTPEPGGIFLAIAAQLNLLAMSRRRRR